MPTVDDALAAYELQLRANGRSQHTLLQVRRHVRLFRAWLALDGRSPDMAQINVGVVAAFMAAPVATCTADGRRRMATSANALRSSLRGFFAFAADSGAAPVNAGRLLRSARVGDPLPRALTDEQQERLLRALDQAEPRDRLAFWLMLRAGLRLGSVVALDLEDCDLDQGVLEVRLKGDRRERVHVPRDVRDGLVAFLGGRVSGPVFVGRAGRRLTGRHLQRRFAALARQGGLPAGTSCHTMRHTFATGLLRRTGNLELVRRALCHRAVSTTGRYLRVEDGELRAAIGT